jgi:hypothetical protein
MKSYLIYSLAFFTLINLFSCGKELSLEESNAKSAGSLLSDLNNECLPKTVEGTYKPGKTLNDSNFILVEVDVTNAGSYTITTDTVNGYSFSSSGSFSNTGINTVKLKGNGKPLTIGSNYFTLNFDSTTCDILVEVTSVTSSPPPTSTYFWRFTSGGKTYQGSVDADDTQFSAIGGPSILGFTGYTITEDTVMIFILADKQGGINKDETYNTNSQNNNGGGFQVHGSGTGNTLFLAETTSTLVNITTKITSHNTATKVVEGTFSGTALDKTGAKVNVTNGQFKVNYQ